MQIGLVLTHTSELGKPVFGNVPEAFDVVDVVLTSGEFVLAMVDTKMLAVSDIDENIVAFKAIQVNDTTIDHHAPDDGLQCDFGTVRQNLGIALAKPFDKTEYDGLAISASVKFAFK